MGSSNEDPSKVMDISVGGLVWVRRRNGSWWPGRILGADELPEGCLPTPRSGTPVKLLGREDASVDWYNLEKSKRVKPFRCGEYDDCIEKAKASASLPSRKAVKYARREDAIIHALELESACLGKDYQNLPPSEPNSQPLEQPQVEESPSSSHRVEGGEDIDENLILSVDDQHSTQELSNSGVSFEEPFHADAIKEEPKRRRTPNDSEDDGTEGVKRMRGLEDLGMGVSPPMRRKRSQVANGNEFLKKKNRRRPLAKVLECTAMVSVPVVSDQLSSPTESSVPEASESKASELESNESKMNSSLIMNNNSDSTGVSCENAVSLSTPNTDVSLGSKSKENEISSMLGIPEIESAHELFDVPLVAEEKLSAGLSMTDCGASQKARVGAGAQSSQSSHVEIMSLGNEEHNETGSTSSGTVDLHNLNLRIEKGASEWQLKGKRNSRARKMDVYDEAETHVAGLSRNVDPNRVGGSLISDIQVQESRGWSWNAHHKDSHTTGLTAETTAAPSRLLPYRQSRCTVNPKYDSSDFSLRHHTAGSGLFDVEIEVKTGYRPPGVPYISLMSKSRGQPIIGHPLTIEVLEDGYCDEMILRLSECYYSSSSEFYENRSDAYSLQNGGTAYDEKPRGRRPNKRRSLSKFSRGRKNGLSSKKIRKLSSLTGAQRQSREPKKPVLEKMKGPSIACVPLNVVFSRINAALNNSTRPAPRLVADGGV